MGAKSKSIWINYNYIPLSWFNVAPSLPNALKTNIILAADSIAKIKKKKEKENQNYIHLLRVNIYSVQNYQ